MTRKITKGVYYVGVDDYHTELFEGLWSLPHGVSYNSYLIVAEKIAVIEGVKEPWTDEWLDNIRKIVDPAKIDYIILNHMEPDHTGSIQHLAAIAKNATVVYTPRASDIQKSFYDLPLPEKIVADLEELDLGGKVLKFVHAPWLHWPETMMTYLIEDEILFSCDAFGAFGALNGDIFDDEIDMRMVEKESRRYVSSIITSYLRFVQKGIKKVKELDIGIKMIAPSHGPIYRKDPMWIVQKYDEWSSPELDKYCVIVYGSMYGFNHRVAMRLKKELLSLGVDVKIHNVSYTDISTMLTDAVRAGVIVLGTPTYDAFPFPKVWLFFNEMIGKRFIKRPVGIFGTFGWGGGGAKKLQQWLVEKGWNVIDPVIRVRGRPNEDESKAITELARKIADIMK